MEHPTESIIFDPRVLLMNAAHSGPIWSLNSEQLNINVLRFGTGEGISPHINDEVDVLIGIVEGEGALTLGDEEYPIRIGEAALIPRGGRSDVRPAPWPISAATAVAVG